MTDENVNNNRELAQTSLSLLARVQSNDPPAWERLVRLYSPLVYRWCRQTGLQEADAADVGQEVFHAVAAGIGGFRHDQPGATFRGWLRTITRTKLADFGRRAQRQAKGAGGSDALYRLLALAADDSADNDPTIVDEDNQLVYRRAIELVLDEFESTTRQAFVSVVIDERTPAETANRLGITTNAVYLAKSRVLSRLRAELTGLQVP